MADTLIARRQENKLIQRVAELEEIVQSMRANQNQKLTFGNITIDGTGNVATIQLGNGQQAGVVSKLLIGNTITISDDGNGHGTIFISDLTNNRILAGYQQGGF